MIREFVRLLREIHGNVRTDWVLKHSAALNDIEYGQTFSNYAAAAKYAYDLAKYEGLEAELLTFPADGKTTYLDTRTPMAWAASMGRLTVVKSEVSFDDAARRHSYTARPGIAGHGRRGLPRRDGAAGI